MKTLHSDAWLRLATAAINARDDLRGLAAQIDRALRTPGSDGDVALLEKVRALAIRHADSLRMGLKHPN